MRPRNGGWPRSEVAALIDHTLLRPESTRAQILALVQEAGELGVAAVCVPASMVGSTVEAADGAVPVAAVVGFPSGKHVTVVKATEAAMAVAAGATEVDMVIDIGAAIVGDLKAVHTDIAAVRAAVPAVVLKVIVESAALLRLADADTLVDVCRTAEGAGADFVKTSTGFHPAGGASIESVTLMAKAVGGRVGIKASGGIRTAEAAVAMLEAGATRLGLSATRAVLDELG